MPYFGGKSSSKLVGRWVAAQTLVRSNYVEPFCGMLGVLRQRPKARVEVANDLDSRIVTWWKVMRERTTELQHLLLHTPWSRVEYERAQRELDGDDDLSVAYAVTVVLLQSTFSGLPGTGWRCGERWVTAEGLADAMSGVADRLREVRLECRNAVDVLTDWVGKPDTMVYCDPPYQHVDLYAHGVDFDVLASVLCDAEAAVAISGYDTCGWDRLGWRRTELTTEAQLGNGPRVECLWMNYEPEGRLL